MNDDFVESWRGQLTESLVHIAHLAPEAQDVDFATGLLATGVLWPIHMAVQEFNGDAIDAIRDIAGPHAKHVLRAVQKWDGDQLAAARNLATAAAENSALAEGLSSIVAHFDAANLLSARLGMLPPAVVNEIKAALVNIGGIINIQALTLNVVQTVEIPPPPRPEPPPEVGTFVGRTRELAHYREMLAASHLAFISGMVGVGKTTLAAMLARETNHLDKIFWHTFHASESIEVIIWKLAAFLAWHGQEELWRMLQNARQTGDHPAPADTLFDYILQMIEGRDFCLCCDDLHLVAEDPLLLRFVERLREAVGTGRLKLVITARWLPAFIKTVELDPLDGFSAEDARLMLTRWGLVLPPALFDRLYVHTGGNAQFLTLAINILQHEADPASAIDRLVESQDVERYLLAEVDERLTEDEQAVMGAVAALMGYPGSQDALEALLDGESIRRTVRRLTDRHLLIERDGTLAREYQQHAMVQSFYYDLLGRSRRNAMHLRAAAYYEKDEPELLRAALHYQKAQAYSKSVELATENVRVIIGLYQARGLVELLNQFDAQRLNELEWMRVRAALAQVYAFLGERAKALECFELARVLLDGMDDSPEVSRLRVQVYQGLGQMQYNENPEEALIWLQRAFTELGHFSDQGDSVTEASLYIDMAWANRRLHNVAEAVTELQLALERLPRKSSQLRGEALTRLAALYVAQFDLINAQRFASVAVENSRQLREVWHEQSVLAMLGTIKHLSCDWQGAIAEYEAALTLASAIGDRSAQAALEVNLGIALTNLGNPASAHLHLARGLELSQQSLLHNHVLKAQMAIARLCLRTGEWEAAEQHLDDAENIVSEIGTEIAKYHLPLILSARAEAYFGNGRNAEALSLARESVRMAIEQEKQVDRATCQRVLAQILSAQGDDREAVELLVQSLPLLDGKHDYEAARINLLLGQCLRRLGDAARADELIEAARVKFETYGAKFDLAQVLSLQA